MSSILHNITLFVPLYACPSAGANRCAWVTGEDFEEEDEEVFSLTHKLPLIVESTRLNMIDKSASVSNGGSSVACPWHGNDNFLLNFRIACSLGLHYYC
jgi:hypothetical protein